MLYSIKWLQELKLGYVILLEIGLSKLFRIDQELTEVSDLLNKGRRHGVINVFCLLNVS